jgi:hypothetical protein
MTYILIVLLHYGQAGFTAEFTSKDKCEQAAQTVLSNYSYYGSGKPNIMCVEK